MRAGETPKGGGRGAVAREGAIAPLPDKTEILLCQLKTRRAAGGYARHVLYDQYHVPPTRTPRLPL